MASRRGLTGLEQILDRWARRILSSVPKGLREFLVFGIKQAWACLFGALMLVAIVACAWLYPAGATIDRNDALVGFAFLIQVMMIVFRLETGRELIIIVVFHVVGTGMEIFKTAVGSWEYSPGGILHIGAVPLFTGFMYAAVGSYLARVYRLFDLRFNNYPRLWVTAVIATVIYINFFTHHYILDFRWALLIVVTIVFLRCRMHFRVYTRTFTMPILVAFGLVAFFIWIAENVGTAAGVWLYPNQMDGWHLVPLSKLVAWFLLMIISVVLVTFINPPNLPATVKTRY